MARGRRRNIIQSHEYLSEVLVGQKSYQQTYASSNLDPSTNEDQLDRENNNEIIASGIYKAIVDASLFDSILNL
jgi:hypothetical protein